MTALGRAINAAFCFVTAIYCLLTYSPFAYEQFIQPRIIPWLGDFAVFHTDLYWLALCVTTLTLVPHLRGSPARAAAWAYVGAGAATGVTMALVRVLPAGNEPSRSVAIALLALVPVVWLAAIDHLTARPRLARTVDPSRLLLVCIGTALFVWATYAVAAPVRLRSAAGIVASAAAPQLLIGVSASLIAELTAFTMLFLVLSILGAAWLHPAAAIGLAFILQRVVLAPMSVTGAASWVLAFWMAGALVLFVTGLARQYAPPRNRAVPAAILLALPAAAYVATSLLTTFDWGFMLQKLGALVVAVVAFRAIRSIAAVSPPEELAQPARPVRRSAVVAVPLFVAALFVAGAIASPRLPAWFGDARLRADFALDAYSAADPSFRLVQQFLQTQQSLQSDAAFYAYLRAHSSIKDEVSPVSIDFVPRFAGLAEPPPHIFLFIIDSLRRDYVSVYNPAVTFTPHLAAFANDSIVFDRAFSRYGGTGLAVPSIWAGAMQLHKEYVKPFAPMNALAKLLEAGSYRRVITSDHITADLFGLGEGTTLLDERVPEMLHTFCRTMQELKDDLRAHAGDRRPIFAHTRPLDLHIGRLRFAPVPPGESYPGFFGPSAAQVRRIDACFGDFVSTLKHEGLYEDSIIVVMSDHGDSLGEGLRWGHGYTIVPEVLRIPLLIHLPAALRARFVTDVTRVAFSTDVTPTLYALLGQPPRRPRRAAGVPLFVPNGSEIPSRRREPFLVASSYGAVYGIVRHNGRRLYIADAIEGRDSMYDLTPGAGDARIGMTDAERVANRAHIREQIADLASWYGMQR